MWQKRRTKVEHSYRKIIEKSNRALERIFDSLDRDRVDVKEAVEQLLMALKVEGEELIAYEEEAKKKPPG